MVAGGVAGEAATGAASIGRAGASLVPAGARAVPNAAEPFIAQPQARWWQPQLDQAGPYSSAVSAAGATTDTEALKALARTGITQSIGAAGAQTGMDMAQKIAPDSVPAQVIGATLGGVGAGGLAATYPRKLGGVASIARAQLTDEGRAEALQTAANSEIGRTINDQLTTHVKNRLATDMKGYLDSEKALQESTTLAQQFPGVQLTPGQASGVPNIIQREQHYARSTAEALNERIAAERANQQAITNKIDQTLPSQYGDASSSIQGMQKNQAGQLTAADAEIGALDAAKADRINVMRSNRPTEEVGQELKDIRARQKEAYTGEGSLSKTLYDDAFKSADEAGMAINGAPVIAKADEMIKSSIFGGKSIFSSDVGKQIVTAQERAGVMDLRDADSMRREINTAMGIEQSSRDPTAPYRLRELTSLRNSLDEQIAASGHPEVAKKYESAVDYWRKEIAPRFSQEENRLLGMKSSMGGQAIEPAQAFDAYLVAGNAGVAPMNRYLKLFGETPDGKRNMESEVMDRYAKMVMPNGEFKAGGHDRFMEQYGQQLDKLSATGSNIKETLGSADSAVKALSERRQFQVDNREQIANGALAKILKNPDGSPADVDKVIANALHDRQSMMAFLNSSQAQGLAAGADPKAAAKAVASVVFNKMGKSVLIDNVDYPFLDPTKLRTQLTEKSDVLLPLFSHTYGPKKAAEYMQTLENVARMAEVQSRSQVSKNKLPLVDQGASNDPLKEKINISTPTFFAMARAVITGRTSPELSAMTLGGQSATGLVQKKMSKIEQQILSDPDSAKQLLEIMRSGAQPNSKAKAYLKLGAQLGNYWIGTKNYGPLANQLGIPIAASAIEQENKNMEHRGALPVETVVGRRPIRMPAGRRGAIEERP